MTVTQFTDAVEIEGSQDTTQLKVQGHTSQTDPLQVWQDSSGDPLAQITGDGRLQIGSFDDGMMATDDALIEAHRHENATTKPKRGLHLLGEMGGTLDEIVSWIVQEVILKDPATVNALHEVLRVRLRNEITADVGSSTALQAGSIEVENTGGSSTEPIPTMSGLRVGLTNSGYVTNGYGVEIEVNDSGTSEELYGLHVTGAPTHLGKPLELAEQAAAPDGKVGVVQVYPKTDGKLYAKDAAGTEYDLTGGGGGAASLDDLSDVDTSGASNGDVLTYNGTDWEPQMPAIGEVFPTGSIMLFAGASAPTGWLLCQGQAVSRTTYSVLFGTIGTTYGIGNGSTTFNLPDLRGRVTIGAGQGSGLSNRVLGDVLGEEEHALTISEMPSHNHSVTRSTGTSGSPPTLWGINNQTSSINSGNRGGNSAHNNMQPSLVMNYIIKA